MPRASWKGPYVAVALLKDVVAFARSHPEWWSRGRFQGTKAPEIIHTHCRSSVILPDFVALKFGVHNGKSFVPIEVSEPMIGHRLGEFAPSKKVPVHKKKESSGGAKKNPKTGKAA